MQEGECDFRTLAELSFDAVLILADDRVQYCNSAAVQLVGFQAAEEFIGLEIGPFLHPHDRDFGRKRRIQILENGLAMPSHPFRLLQVNGKVVEVFSKANRVMWGGRPAIQVVFHECRDESSGTREIRRSHRSLETIRQTQERYLVDPNPQQFFQTILAELISLTESEFGFIAEVRTTSVGNRYLLAHAIAKGAAIDGASTDLADQPEPGVEFHNLGTLFGVVVETGRTVISNDAANDPRRGELPGILPETRSFLGLPLQFGERILGIVGLSNRPTGYDERLADDLSPILSTCSHLIESYRNDVARRQAEKSLRQSEEHLRAIFDAEPQCIKLVARDGTLVAMNRAGLDMVGARSLDDVRGRSLVDLIVPEHREQYRSLHERVCGGSRGTVEFDIVGFNGIRRRMQSHSVPFHGQALSVTIDISDRKQSEDAVRLSELKYRTIFDNTLEGMFQSTPEGRLLEVNSTLARIYGFDSPAEAVTHFHDLATQLYVDPSRRLQFIRAIEANGAVKGFEFELRRKDGTFAWVRESARAVRDTDGRLVCFEGTVEDITERRRAEQALRESEERYRLVVEGSLQGILIHQDGVIRYANEALARMFEYESPAEIIGRRLWDTFVDSNNAPVLQQRTEELLAGKPLAPHPGWKAVGKYGREIWVTTSASRIELNGRPAIVAFYLDITERERAEQERRKMELQFQHAQKLESLGILAGGIAHDFNNLLTAIMGYASLTRMSVPDDSRAASMLDEIEKAGQRAAELATQMLAYAGKGKFVLEILPINFVVREMSRLLETVVSKKATLHLDLSPANLEGDPTQIRQVVMNLITNASDALGGQAGSISITTGVRAMRADQLHSPYFLDDLPGGNYAFLEIRDSGCGMSEETRLKIFDPFFTTKFTGRGLGLAAVLGIVRGHRGTIHVESTPGAGTTFQLFFPAHESPLPPLRTTLPDQSRPDCTGTVLVVEDEESIRKLVQRFLEGQGYRIYCAEDGCAGLEQFEKHRDEISTILLDLTMPNMDGAEFLKRVRSLPSTVPVILMSGFAEAEKIIDRDGLIVSGFLQKPFRTRELLDLMYSVGGQSPVDAGNEFGQKSNTVL